MCCTGVHLIINCVFKSLMFNWNIIDKYSILCMLRIILNMQSVLVFKLNVTPLLDQIKSNENQLYSGNYVYILYTYRNYGESSKSLQLKKIKPYGVHLSSHRPRYYTCTYLPNIHYVNNLNLFFYNNYSLIEFMFKTKYIRYALNT